MRSVFENACDVGRVDKGNVLCSFCERAIFDVSRWGSFLGSVGVNGGRFMGRFLFGWRGYFKDPVISILLRGAEKTVDRCPGVDDHMFEPKAPAIPMISGDEDERVGNR